MKNEECRCAFISGIYRDRNGILKCTKCFKEIQNLDKIPNFEPPKKDQVTEDLRVFLGLFIVVVLLTILAFMASEIHLPDPDFIIDWEYIGI